MAFRWIDFCEISKKIGTLLRRNTENEICIDFRRSYRFDFCRFELREKVIDNIQLLFLKRINFRMAQQKNYLEVYTVFEKFHLTKQDKNKNNRREREKENEGELIMFVQQPRTCTGIKTYILPLQ